MSEYKDALEDMTWQFAYRGTSGGRSILYTGGLSSLEYAFRVLGWDDPYCVPDQNGPHCDVVGCAEWAVSQGIAWPETGYWHVCSEHADSARKGESQPVMKQRALDKEASRDADGRLPLKSFGV